MLFGFGAVGFAIAQARCAAASIRLNPLKRKGRPPSAGAHSLHIDPRQRGTMPQAPRAVVEALFSPAVASRDSSSKSAR